jgi:protein-S-isoprenylcysteine O-methyltransferase Ste14
MSVDTLSTVFCWVVFLLYWWLMSRKVKSTAYAQSSAARSFYLFFLLLGFVLLYAPVASIGPLGYQIIPVSQRYGTIGAVISLLGVWFAIWARKTLGDNWSGNVTFKKGHELIQSGPYKIVRHPIYTGFELCFLGAAITIGQLKGFVGLAIIFFNHMQKINLEEEIMKKQFPGQYEDYSKRVKRLIPFVF